MSKGKSKGIFKFIGFVLFGITVIGLSYFIAMDYSRFQDSQNVTSAYPSSLVEGGAVEATVYKVPASKRVIPIMDNGNNLVNINVGIVSEVDVNKHTVNVETTLTHAIYYASGNNSEYPTAGESAWLKITTKGTAYLCWDSSKSCWGTEHKKK